MIRCDSYITRSGLTENNTEGRVEQMLRTKYGWCPNKIDGGKMKNPFLMNNTIEK